MPSSSGSTFININECCTFTIDGNRILTCSNLAAKQMPNYFYVLYVLYILVFCYKFNYILLNTISIIYLLNS